MKNSSSARTFLFLALIVLLFSAAGCSKSNDSTTPAKTGGSQGANEVWLQGSLFSPATLTVAVNTTVKWTNMDSYAHTVISDSPLFNSGNIGSNGTFSYPFTAKGTYPYHCSIHPMMTGTIIVQ